MTNMIQRPNDFLMERVSYGLAVMLGVAAMLTGCGRGNGLPADLVSHLAQRGINITPSRVQAPLSSRGGYVVTGYSAHTATNIIGTFKLEATQPGDRQWRWAVDRAGGVGAVKEVWGVAGRPAQFKLKSGGQFEYFYLLITEDGLMYLVAEYAYG
jgi:hypothetical protein